MTEQLRIEQEVKQGKKIAHNAEAIWRWDTVTGVRRANRRSQFFVSKGSITAQSNILELGCGTGLFTELVYQKSGAKITAIDISDDLLEIAKKKYTHSVFEKMNASKLRFGNNEFDLVFGSSVLHHLDYQIALKEIFRVLKGGGKLVFAEPNLLNPHIFLQKKIPFLKRRAKDCPHETAFIRWKLKEDIESTGFVNVNIQPYDFLYPLIPNFAVSFISSVGGILEKLPLVREIAGSLIISAEKK